MDKELYEVIADMLIKQDETIDAIKATSKRIDKTNEILLNFMDKTTDFIGMSVKQWDAQQKFNERFFDSIQNIEKKVDSIEKKMDNFQLIEEKIRHLDNIEERLVKLERLLKVS